MLQGVTYGSYHVVLLKGEVPFKAELKFYKGNLEWVTVHCPELGEKIFIIKE
jgi:hypothetical protein